MYECPVCFEQLNEKNTFETDCCNQKSCKDCLIEWQKSSKICMYCRHKGDDVIIIVNDESDIESINIFYKKRYELICYFLFIIALLLIIFRNYF